MKGWRTLLINAALGGLAVGLSYAAGINWVDFVDPHWAVLIVTVVNIGLRFITSTPVGKNE